MRGSQIRFDHARVVRDFLWRALGDLLAVAHADDLLRDRHDDAHVVLDDEDRDAALVDLADDRDRLLDLGGVEPREVLVEEEKLWLRREGCLLYTSDAADEEDSGDL